MTPTPWGWWLFIYDPKGGRVRFGNAINHDKTKNIRYHQLIERYTPGFRRVWLIERLLCVQKYIRIILYSNLLHKMGPYFLDTLKHVKVLFWTYFIFGNVLFGWLCSGLQQFLPLWNESFPLCFSLWEKPTRVWMSNVDLVFLSCFYRIAPFSPAPGPPYFSSTLFITRKKKKTYFILPKCWIFNFDKDPGLFVILVWIQIPGNLGFRIRVFWSDHDPVWTLGIKKIRRKFNFSCSILYH